MTSAEGTRAANLPARRRADLTAFIQQRGQATIGELAKEFAVSVDTVRRDLDHLAARGLVARTHGGAVPGGELATADSPVADRMNERREAKDAIGAAAARLVRDNETLLVNGGTTVLSAVAALGGHRGLTIVTNNLRVPGMVPAQALRDLFVLGGACRTTALVTIGPIRFPDTAGVSADTALIAVGGVSASGLSVSNIPEAQMIQEMMDSASRVVVLADTAKFERRALARICPLNRVDVLVSEQPPSGELALALERAEVTLAGPYLPEDDG
ncbi:DeoR/GlpR family DNA-binding transcription regulator [Streptomyces sp. NPDC059850]|uniref:DeoR/GlpR family DNA-binding transcription regulator n=1 Tax=Streptomyces sp. NPDC059850 TaxID=3346970 RepID=UPI003665FBD9